MNKALIAITLFFAGLIGIAYIGPSFVDWSEYKGQATQAFSEHTGLKLEISGGVGLSLLPSPYVYAKNVSIANENAAQPDILSVERIDLSLNLWPLFSGEIDINAFALEKPALTISIDTEGRQNWQTEKIAALMQESESVPNRSNAAPNFNFNRVDLDHGALTYINAQNNQRMEFEDIVLSVSAQSLLGPYIVNGAFELDKQDIEYQIATEKLNAETGEIEIDLSANSDDESLALGYNGIVGLAAFPDFQGQLNVKGTSQNEILKPYIPQNVAKTWDHFALSAVATVSGSQTRLDEAKLQLGNGVLQGYIFVKNEPFMVETTLKSQGVIQIPAIDFAANDQDNADITKLVPELLPATINMPQNMNVRVQIDLTKLSYNNQLFDKTAVLFEKEDKVFSLEGSIENTPGQGTLALTGNLTYGSSSTIEDQGIDVLSDPHLKAKIDVQAQNMGQMAESLLPVPDNVNIAGLKQADIRAEIEAHKSALTLKKSLIKLGNERFDLSGEIKPPSGKKRGQVVLDLTSGVLDLAILNSNKSQKSTNLTEAFERFEPLPYDLRFDIGAERLDNAPYPVSGLRAQGAIESASLTLTNVSAQNMAGFSAKIGGKIGNINSLSDVDIRLQAQTADVDQVKNVPGLEQIPEDILKSVSTNMQFKGNKEALRADVDLKSAENGNLSLSGDIISPLNSPKVQNISAKLTHNNANTLVKLFDDGFEGFASWSKPVKLSANLSQSENEYALNDLNGKWAGTDVQADVKVNLGSAIPELDINANLGNLAMKRLSSGSSIKSVRAQRKKPAKSQSKKWSDDVFSQEMLQGINANISLKISSIIYDPWFLNDVKLSAQLKDQKLSIDTFRSQLYDGKINVKSNISNDSGQVVANADITVEDVDFAPFLRSFAGGDIVSGKGRLSFNANVETSGNTQHSLVQNLNGDGDVQGSEIVIEGFDLTKFARALSSETKPGDTLQGLWSGTTSGGSSYFETLSGTYTINQGVIRTNDLTFTGPEASILSKGTVDLPRWYLDTTNTVSIQDETKDIPSFDVKLAGPLDNPAQTLGQGILEDYFSRKINRKLQKLLQDKLNIPGPSPQPNSSPNDPQGQGDQRIRPEDAFRDLLKGVLQ